MRLPSRKVYQERDQLKRELDLARKGCGGVLWLNNNIEHYGTDEWKQYFLAVVEDAKRGHSGLA